MKRNSAMMMGLLVMGMMYRAVQAEEKDLGTIVVTPTRSAVSLKDAPANVTVITNEEIIQSGAVDLGELLTDYPVATIGKNGGLGALSTLSIRGSTAEQVLVMIDGRPVNDTTFGTAQPQQILLTNIEQVEIIRGGSSSLYGANAVGGVINLITRKAASTVPVTEASLSYGSFNKKLYNIGVGIKKENADVFISGDRQTSEGYRINEDLDSDHVFLSAGYDCRSLGSITLKGDIFRSEAGVPGPNSTPVNQWNDSLERTASTPDDRWKTDNRYGAFEHTVLVREQVRVRTRIYGNIDEKKFIYSNASWNTLYENASLGSEMQLDIPYNITLGGDYRQDKFFQKSIESNMQIANKKFLNRAVYAQKTFDIGTMQYIPGIRVDNHSAYDEEINPRILILRRLSENSTLSINASRSFRAPTFNEIINNSTIEPEISKSYDIGIKTTCERIKTGITAFLSDTRDLIVWQPNILTFTWEPININGTTRSQGVEANITQKLSTYFDHSLSYTYTSVKDRETDRAIFYKPAHKGSYSLVFSNKQGRRISASLRGEGRQFITQSATTSIPGYGVLDLKFSQRIHDFLIMFGVDNAFDKRYLNRQNYPLAGRTIYGTVSLKLFD